MIKPVDLRFLIPYASVLAGLYWLKSAWAAILLYECGMAAFLLARRAKPEFGRFRISYPSLFWPALAGSLLSGPVLIALWHMVKLPDAEMVDVLARFGLQGTSFIIFAVLYSSLHPLLEEMFWRFGAGPGNVRYYEDLLFAGYHLLVLAFFLKPLWLALVFAVLAGAGMTWRRMIAGRGDRLGAVLAHAAGDISTIAATAWLACIK